MARPGGGVSSRFFEMGLAPQAVRACPLLGRFCPEDQSAFLGLHRYVATVTDLAGDELARKRADFPHGS
jgi:hypothetical protein